MKTDPSRRGPINSAAARCGMLVIGFVSALLLVGCGKSKVDQALDSDANGYVCLDCNARFYTDRKVFPTRCPDCKKPHIEQAIGYFCTADQQTTIGPRGLRSMPCKKCGAATTGLNIPHAADFKAWGAARKTEAEVTGG